MGGGCDESCLVGVDHCLDAVAQAELAEQVGDVALNGGLRDVERVRDLGVRQPGVQGGSIQTTGLSALWARAQCARRCPRFVFLSSSSAWRPARSCFSSNWEEIRPLDVAPARSRERQRRGRLLAGTSQAIGKRLRDRTVGTGVAPEFMPKRNSELSGNGAGRSTTWRVPRLATSRSGP